MCGGALISDFIEMRRGHGRTSDSFWSDLDAISDLLGLDPSGVEASQNPTQQHAKGTHYLCKMVHCYGFDNFS